MREMIPKNVRPQVDLKVMTELLLPEDVFRVQEKQWLRTEYREIAVRWAKTPDMQYRRQSKPIPISAK